MPFAPSPLVPGDSVVAMTREGEVTETGKITRMFARRGSTAVPLERAVAGDIVQIAGLQVMALCTM